MIEAVEGLGDIERIAIVALGFGIVAEIIFDGAEVDEIVGDVRMAVTIELPIHGQNSLVQGFGGIVMAGVKMRVGQLAQGLGEIGRACAPGGLQARCFLENLDGSVIRTAILQYLSQSAGGAGKGGMSRREFLPVDG